MVTNESGRIPKNGGINSGVADTNIVGKPAEENLKKTVMTRLRSPLNPSELAEIHRLEVVQS